MNSVILILMAIEVIVVLIINIKKIKTVRIDKHITWELEVYSSVISIVYIILCLILEVIEYSCPEFYHFVDFLIRFIAPIVKILGVNIIIFHSLSVVLYKYYIIVIQQPVTYSSNSMNRKWLLGLIAFPIIWTIPNFVRYTAMTAFILPRPLSCNSIGFKDQMTLFCHFNGDDHYNNNWTFLFIITQIYCLVHTFINVVLKLNILDAFLYFKLFRFMNR